MQKNTSASHRQKKGRLILLSLVIFFVSPLILVIYMHQTNWHPQGESVGQLIAPVVKLEVPSSFQKVKSSIKDPSDVSNNLWHDKWSIVLIAQSCDQICASRLYDVRQIHASLEKNMNRVQRILITHQQDVALIQERYPDLLILNQPSTDVDLLANQFNQGNQNAFDLHNVYLVDPLGQWMMQYSAEVSARDLRKDVVQLLRYSWAG